MPRRSTKVAAPLLAAAALALTTACRPKPEMQRCVDEQNHVVADNLCQGLPPAGAAAPPVSMGYIPYRYYYGGGGGYGLGSPVFGGGYIPSTGHTYSSASGRSTFVPSGTVRGGFGSSHAGGGGEGE